LSDITILTKEISFNVWALAEIRRRWACIFPSVFVHPKSPPPYLPACFPKSIFHHCARSFFRPPMF
ncbi:hypothetical protein T07_1121, partial [Trichinella nelsoni]